MTTPREDAIDALRVILTQEPEDGSFAIEIEPGDGQRLLTAGADAVDAILNAQEAWPELTLTAGHWVDLASPEAAEALARAWGEVMDGRRIGSGLNAARINADTTTEDDWRAILATMRGTGR